MNELSVFAYQGHPIRTIYKDGEVWFVAKDVCDMLDIRDTWNAMQRLQESVKGTDSISTPGGPQQATIINEAGLYKLAFTSRKPEAEGFTDFVAGTILPTIRKTGQYQAKPMTQAEILAAQAQLLVDQERRITQLTAETRKTADVVGQIAEMAAPVGDTGYREKISKKIRAACYRYNENYQNAYNYLYMTLEATAHCDLDARVRNKRDRLTRAGALKSIIDDVNKLDVIAEDAALMNAFDLVVQRWAMSLAARSGGTPEAAAV